VSPGRRSLGEGVERRRHRSERLYELLLRLYPRAFRDRFELQLLELFRDKERAAASRGLPALIVFWIRIIRDGVASGLAERLAAAPGAFHIEGKLMEGLLHDIRYALRMIVRRPTLSAVIVITLALGIGANTAIFSLVHTVLLRPQPYPAADRLVRVWDQQLERSANALPVRPANFFDWKGRTSVFEDIAWSRDSMLALTGDGEPESIIAYRFSPNMLDVLGVQPAIGRGFTPEEDKVGGPRVVILSDKLWKRRYGADRGILGRAITLNGQPHTVIGVMPPQFKHPARTELWLPIALTPTQVANRNATVLRLVGRLRPGVTREHAQAELAGIYQDLAARYPASNKGLSPSVEQFGQTGDAKPLLLVLFAGVGFVLLIACVNVANLLIADAASRRRELAVRSALGATRYRVVRQMLTESTLLSLAGGALGLFVTWWMRDALVSLFPTNIFNLNLPVVEQIDVGPWVFLFAMAVSVATGLIFGSLPAWSVARGALQETLRDGDRGTSSRRTHAALVIAEVALSIVLLAGALLMVQSFLRVQKLNLGFDTKPVLSGRVLLPAYRYSDEARIAAFIRELQPRLQAIPGVEASGIVQFLPLSGWSGGVDFTIEGRPAGTGAERPSASSQIVSEDYFRTMGIPILTGRAFTSSDIASAPRVAVVNEALAKRHWPGDSPVGKKIQVDGGQQRGMLQYEIVGVIGNVRAAGLEQPVEEEMYFALPQNPAPLLCITLRTSADPASLAGQLRAAVWSIDREQPVTYVMPMAALAAESIAFRRAGMLLAGGFGVLALILAALGIYGVLSYSVSRRTREIGVRMALGATRRDVAGLVVREGLLMTAAGVVLGLAAALGLTRFLEKVLYEVRPGDPVTYVAVAAILMGVALVATWLPARRATAVDPLVALRAE